MIKHIMEVVPEKISVILLGTKTHKIVGEVVVYLQDQVLELIEQHCYGKLTLKGVWIDNAITLTPKQQEYVKQTGKPAKDIIVILECKDKGVLLYFAAEFFENEDSGGIDEIKNAVTPSSKVYLRSVSRTIDCGPLEEIQTGAPNLNKYLS